MTKRKPLNRGNKKENQDRSRATPGPSGTRNPRPSKKSAGTDRRDRTKTSPYSKATRSPQKSGGSDWLYGVHAVEAALANPRRTLHELLATARAADVLPEALKKRITPTLKSADEIAAQLPEGAVHQGLALKVAPLPETDLGDLLADPAVTLLVMLDQVSDPHNVGAILRSAAAFGAAAVIVQDRHAPQVTGVLAKTASGALEVTPLLRVTNLSRTLEECADAGFYRIGLAGEASVKLSDMSPDGRTVLVLGAEGPGLRRLTRENCDALVRLPTREPISSLNVSNAAAVALYALSAGRVPPG